MKVKTFCGPDGYNTSLQDDIQGNKRGENRNGGWFDQLPAAIAAGG
jgi:hypothetical protein